MGTMNQYRQLKPLEWFIDEVVPNDHPCLYSQSSHSGNTMFMQLVKDGNIKMAERVLEKITDSKVRLQLLNAKKLAGRHGGESALEWAKRDNVQPIVEWVMEQMAD